MNKKQCILIIAGLLWLCETKASINMCKDDFGGSCVSQEEEEGIVDPPDWYKSGLAAALQDRNSYSYLEDISSLFIAPQEWLSAYFSSQQRLHVVDKLMKRLNDEIDSDIGWVTEKALIKFQAKDVMIPKLIKYLTDESATKREAAIKVLGRLKVKEAISGIIECLSDPNTSVRHEAIQALKELDAKEAIPKLMESLDDENIYIPRAAIDTLVQFQAKEVIPKLTDHLTDANNDMRIEAIHALGELQAKEVIPKLIENLADNDPRVRNAALEALGRLQANKAIPKIIALLAEGNSSDTQGKAILTLGQLHANEAIPKLIDHVTDGLQIEAIQALGQLKKDEVIPQLFDRLEDNDNRVRLGAIIVLGELQVKEASPKLIDLLTDKNNSIRIETIQTLGQLQATEAIPMLIERLTDRNNDIRIKTIQTLGQLQAKEAIPILIERLTDENSDIRVEAMRVLGQLQAKVATPKIITYLINTKIYDHRLTAIATLGYLQTPEINLMPTNQFIAIHDQLASLYDNMNSTRKNRFTAHILAGSHFQILVWCLGNNDDEDCNRQTFQDHQKTIEALTIFKAFYQAIPKKQFSPKLRKDLFLKINMVAEALVEQQVELTFLNLWQKLTISQNLASKFKVIADVYAAKEDVALLDSLSQVIAKDDLDIKDLQRKKEAILTKQQWLQSVIAFSGLISLHFGFWIILIFCYPYSRMVQAIFFWNVLVRRIIGFGYIGFCLTWVPFLRRRMLSPFRDSLLADANLATFQPELYFADMSITLKGLNQPRPLIEKLTELKGQFILEGESGLGKTMYLRYLAHNTKHPFAFLHATRCNAGVIPALKEKLHGFAQNDQFLSNIIYAGGLDLCIDGLNEISPDTRAKITQFVEHHFKGNILLSSQPLEWQAPATAKTYRLLPLNRGQIEAFLLSRPEQPANYIQTFNHYLDDALSPHLDKALYELHLRILSNPMDLTVVAHLLAQGIQPNLNSLIQQQYQTMNEDYQSKSFNQNFPLIKFSQQVFDLRLQDKRILNHADCSKELACLEVHKLVIKRTEKEGNTEQENYYFRHDKIWDFFNANILKKHDNEWRKQYFADERFRGAFLALAWSLPFIEAESLLNELQRYIVQSNDNILHHQYYQLVDLRKRLQTI